jgi:uncharacterized membrane protein required for colicin V production
MLAALLVLILIVGFALHQYIKGGLVSGFISIIAVIIAVCVAFGYYELLAGYLRDYSFIGAKGYPIFFVFLFIFVFAVVREVANKLLKVKVSFGLPIDRVGGPALGAIAGYLFAGGMLVVIGLAPFRTNWLYGRFEDRIGNPPLPNSAFLNPDGFISWLFGVISRGSLEGTNSFALLHADYVNQIFLNRYKISEGISPIAAEGAVNIASPGAGAAPENIAAQPGAQEPGKTLTLVPLSVSPSNLVSEGSQELTKFTLSQLRLIAQEKQYAYNLSSGVGEAVYPIGYVDANGVLRLKPLETELGENVYGQGKLDVAFQVPTTSTAVLLEFRQNIVQQILPTAAAPGSLVPTAPQPPSAPQPPPEQPDAVPSPSAEPSN